jgi:hypothetical protein
MIDLSPAVSSLLLTTMQGSWNGTQDARSYAQADMLNSPTLHELSASSLPVNLVHFDKKSSQEASKA